MTLDPTTGTLSGTPAAAGSITFALTVTNAVGFSATRSFTIAVAAAVVTPALAPTGLAIPFGAPLGALAALAVGILFVVGRRTRTR